MLSRFELKDMNHGWHFGCHFNKCIANFFFHLLLLWHQSEKLTLCGALGSGHLNNHKAMACLSLRVLILSLEFSIVCQRIFHDLV